jgi:hypothetical protein
MRSRDGLALRDDKRNTPVDGHRAQRDNERMHPERHDHSAIRQATQRRHAHAGGHTQQRANLPGAGRRAFRSKMVKDQRPEHRGQRVNGAHGKINAARDDDEGGAHRHDGDEAGVLGQLREVLGVEELVLLLHHRLAFASRVRGKDPLALALRVDLEHGQLDRATEHRQHNAQHHDHHQQAGFLQARRGAAAWLVGGRGGIHVTRATLTNARQANKEEWQGSLSGRKERSG